MPLNVLSLVAVPGRMNSIVARPKGDCVDLAYQSDTTFSFAESGPAHTPKRRIRCGRALLLAHVRKQRNNIGYADILPGLREQGSGLATMVGLVVEEGD